jgi:hypothetical protein
MTQQWALAGRNQPGPLAPTTPERKQGHDQRNHDRGGNGYVDDHRHRRHRGGPLAPQEATAGDGMTIKEPRINGKGVTQMNDTSRESSVRRKLRRQGYALRKDRARTWNSNHQGGYMIIWLDGNWVEAGENYTLTLDDAEALANPDQ